MRTLATAAALVIVGVSPGLQAQVRLADVVERTVAYVERFERAFGSVVAEERYEQTVRPSAGRIGASRFVGQETVLVSDFLLVQVPDHGWLPFRDVFERDNRPVRDRQDRLTRLFIDGATAGAVEQGIRIMAESARYNIGAVSRNINVPTLALMFLSEQVRGGVAFTDGRPDPASPGRVIHFEEVARPTLIHTTNDRDLPVRGRLWIDEATGTITRSEIEANDTAIEAAITVTFQADEALGVSVPVRMEERFKRRNDASEVHGVATYSRFRRFQVSTDADIAEPAPEAK